MTETPVHTAPSLPEEITARQKSHTIIYVDDEEHNLRVFRSSFRRHFNVITHSNPIEALETIRTQKIDILVTDQRMPHMTGTQLIETIRLEFPNLISIIITGYSDIEAVTDAINKCGIHRYITKPYDQQELKTTFDEAIKLEQLKKDKEELLTQVKGSNIELESQVEERTKDLQEINHKLIESLEYAESIQKTILSNPDELDGIFHNSMIYYKPLDIVSGDFYILRRLDKRAVIGAFDCTGHGVPGAMLSMLGNAAIDNALASNIVRPSELMVTVNNKINKQLKASANRVGDGMDGSFMLYNKESNKISFSGAKSDVILFRYGQLERVRGNRLSIGERYMDVDQSFDQHNIDATGISEIYMYSDGYRDQINEAYDQRFKTSRFHALLSRIHKEDFLKQSEILDTEFKKWKGTADQTDDIMILGFRLHPTSNTDQ